MRHRRVAGAIVFGGAVPGEGALSTRTEKHPRTVHVDPRVVRVPLDLEREVVAQVDRRSMSVVVRARTSSVEGFVLPPP